MNPEQFKQRVAKGTLDTVLVFMADMQGRLVGKRLTDTVLPNTQRLLTRFRSLPRDPIFARITCLAAYGRDRPLSQARPGFNNLLLPHRSPES